MLPLPRDYSSLPTCRGGVFIDEHLQAAYNAEDLFPSSWGLF